VMGDAANYSLQGLPGLGRATIISAKMPMTFLQKCTVVLAAAGVAAGLGLAYAGWLSPGLVLALADLRLCI
jgi:hypothetical protein